MILRQGNLWSCTDHERRIVCITTNGMVTANGLVMGKGIAAFAKHRNAHLPEEWGKRVKQEGKRLWNSNIYKYGILWPKASFPNTPDLCAFQTKLHWKDPSPIGLIETSVSQLLKITKVIKDIPIYLPMPGCGNGGLKEEQVLPFLECLPDNVFVWSYDKEETHPNF